MLVWGFRVLSSASMSRLSDAKRYVGATAASGKSIYDPIEVGSDLWIPSPELELLLDEGLRGVRLKGLPLRTRSKEVKSRVCMVLGYPVPRSFTKTHPRFPGQCFDTYVQKSNNLQVWNEELSPTRRYVVIRVSPDVVIERVRVVAGDTLALLDTTGTLTQKYQASLMPSGAAVTLTSDRDTDNLAPLLGDPRALVRFGASPTDHPRAGELLPIHEVFSRLKGLVGVRFDDYGSDQERNRGARMHCLVCERLGYRSYQDDGRFPDIRHQLLEVKLQTAPTIDLGLVLPSSVAPLDVPKLADRTIRHCDVRYAVFSAEISGEHVVLTGLTLTTGESFFRQFRQFQGKVLNKKLQIHLPDDFFDR